MLFLLFYIAMLFSVKLFYISVSCVVKDFVIFICKKRYINKCYLLTYLLLFRRRHAKSPTTSSGSFPTRRSSSELLLDVWPPRCISGHISVMLMNINCFCVNFSVFKTYSCFSWLVFLGQQDQKTRSASTPSPGSCWQFGKESLFPWHVT